MKLCRETLRSPHHTSCKRHSQPFIWRHSLQFHFWYLQLGTCGAQIPAQANCSIACNTGYKPVGAPRFCAAGVLGGSPQSCTSQFFACCISKSLTRFEQTLTLAWTSRVDKAQLAAICHHPRQTQRPVATAPTSTRASTFRASLVRGRSVLTRANSVSGAIRFHLLGTACACSQLCDRTKLHRESVRRSFSAIQRHARLLRRHNRCWPQLRVHLQSWLLRSRRRDDLPPWRILHCSNLRCALLRTRHSDLPASRCSSGSLRTS